MSDHPTENPLALLRKIVNEEMRKMGTGQTLVGRDADRATTLMLLDDLLYRALERAGETA